MENIKSSTIDYLNSNKIKYELDTFENAYMIDIWHNNIFVCVQICHEYFGFSVSRAGDDGLGLDSMPDKLFNNIEDFIHELDIVLRPSSF